MNNNYPQSRADAITKLGNRSRRVLGNNTTLETDWQNNPCVVLHSTRIATYTDAGLRVNSGGWWTSTTKDRLNKALAAAGLPYRVCQESYNWYIWNIETGEKAPFRDGTTLTA